MSCKMGLIAEREFELVCLKRGIHVFEPILDNIGIDYVIKRGNKYLSVQVKSTYRKDLSRSNYKVTVGKGYDKRMYDKGDFDFLVMYIFEVSTYYIIPMDEISGKCVRVNPTNGRGKYEKYKEAWHYLSGGR